MNETQARAAVSGAGHGKDTGHGNARDLRPFTDADAAVAEITRLYDAAVAQVRARFARFAAGERDMPRTEACYPYAGIVAGLRDIQIDARPSYGTLPNAGVFGTTLTRPDLFGAYYREQLALLIESHKVPIWVGLSDRQIPLPFVVDNATANVTSKDVRDMQILFSLPDLAQIDDSIANCTFEPAPGHPNPLSLFSAERVDLGLQRLHHYTGTDPGFVQGFVLFTNYQRYVDEFVEYGRSAAGPGGPYAAFVEPGDVVTRNVGHPFAAMVPPGASAPARHLPQMPAYHLVAPDKLGITLINIGVGPANARTITDHLAVLRPHCWLMIGHCGGLRHSQMLGDYVLAHAYIREDHILDKDLPLEVPVPPIAEVQVALQDAVARVTGETGQALKSRMRTGTVFSTDNRNWELRHREQLLKFSQSRAIAIDMESAAIAANGFRFRVPYGTLLCVSDKPMHGEIKLRGMANEFYRQRINQHLKIGIETIKIIQENGVDHLHSRKLRSLTEPPFR